MAARLILLVKDASLDGSKAEDVVAFVEQAIKLVKDQYGGGIKFVTCDSAAANTKPCQLLSDEKYPSMRFE